MRRTVGLLLPGVAALLVVVIAIWPAHADGSSGLAISTSEPTVIEYGDGSGDTNMLKLRRDDQYYIFEDTGAVDIVATDGCEPEDSGAAGASDTRSDVARCPITGINTVRVMLGPEGDQLDVDEASLIGDPLAMLADGQGGDDILKGGPGADSLVGGEGDDQLNGAGGNDRLEVRFAQEGESWWGGNDTLNGGTGNDQLSGGPPSSAAVADTLVGGDGFDTAHFNERSAPVAVDLDDPGGDGERGEGDNVHPDVEHLIGGPEGDTLNGSAPDNVLEGRGGDDTISGRDGNDQLSGGSDSGSDEVSGGVGNDTIDGGGGEDDLRGGDNNDEVSGGGGADELDGGPGGDRLRGGTAADVITGGPGDDLLDGAEPGLTGADGGDTLSGGAGTDALAGARGNDTMDGGAGPDTMDGDAGQDTVTYVNRSGPVTVTLDGVANDGEEGEGDNVMRTVEEVVGGSVDDTLSGDADANTMNGASGEDDLKGNRGRDALTGGNATDLIRARDGNRDVVVCGDDEDIAITDPEDQVRDCETEDAGGRRRLATGRTALVIPVRGEFGVQPPDARRFFTLSETLMIPIGSTIDATRGEVRVTTAGNRAGRRQTLFASGGIFSVRQRRGGRAGAELRLKGPSGRCPRPSGRPGSGVTQDEPKRRLRTRIVKAKKRFKVRGKYSIGAAKGTVWWTEERCDGTLTRVESGSVQVQDLVRDKTVTVRAPDSYLARPR